MDSTASYKFIQTFCKTLTQHQRELLFVLTLWCYIHWLAGSEKGPEPSLDRGPSPWPSACRRAPTEDVFPLLKPQAAYCSDTISHVSLRWASPWRQMANRRAPLGWIELVKTSEADTCICSQTHLNATTSTLLPPTQHTHILFPSAFHASLSSTHFCSASLANHLDFQGHFSSSWPRCYGNFQPPPPPSPWKQDKIEVRCTSRPHYSFACRKDCFWSRIQIEASFDTWKREEVQQIKRGVTHLQLSG